jgi:hypothetical protein
LVYQRNYPKRRFSQDILAEYAGYAVDGAPLFFTVGIIHSFYRPASVKQLAHTLCEASPGRFRRCVQQRRAYGYRDKEYLWLKILTAFLPQKRKEITQTNLR